jgi:hypothetical protein
MLVPYASVDRREALRDLLFGAVGAFFVCPGDAFLAAMMVTVGGHRNLPTRGHQRLPGDGQVRHGT